MLDFMTPFPRLSIQGLSAVDCSSSLIVQSFNAELYAMPERQSGEILPLAAPLGSLSLRPARGIESVLRGDRGKAMDFLGC